MLAAPEGVLAEEIERLELDPAGVRAVPADDPFLQTATVDRAEVQEVLAASGLPEDQRRLIADRHAALREALQAYASTVWSYDVQWGVPKPAAALPDGLRVPDGLFGETADYLEGAIAYHRGRFDAAAAAWERLLQRPSSERRLRSTWAAFMLGKAHLHGSREEAVRWFQLTRALAAQGYRDSLGLAAASLGWEARADMDLHRFDLAIPLYVRQMRSGEEVPPSSLFSLRDVCRRAVEAGPEALQAVARSPEAREILTAVLVARPAWAEPSEDRPAAAVAWLKALDAEGIQDLRGADRLAWVAYAAGDFAAARTWAERAPADAPLALWTRAKLLLRDGKLSEARQLLDEAARTQPPAAMTPDDAVFYVYEGGDTLATGPEAAGESAVVALAQGDYTGALDRFLRAGYWLDAAWVAERVLTLAELQAYVDEKWSDQPPPREVPEEDWMPQTGGLVDPDRERLATDLRSLLGRRLARAGLYEEAKRYFAAPERMEKLGEAVREGHDAARPAAERADALFRAACLMRHDGMQLLGTELDPDWSVLQGNYEDYSFLRDLEARRRNRILRLSADERHRADRHRAAPWKRFHYRYRAADLAWEAALLLPDGSDDKARILATAGTWLRGRDPQAADRFYKALVRCCGRTGLGRAAEERRWFPPVPGCAEARDQRSVRPSASSSRSSGE